MKIDFKKVFQDTLNIIGEVLSKVVVEGAAKQPRVQEEIEKTKIKVAKEAIWKSLPIVGICLVLWFLIKRFK